MKHLGGKLGGVRAARLRIAVGDAGLDRTLVVVESQELLPKTFGNFAFTANNPQFTQQQGIGWVVEANKLHMVFSSENKQFAAFDQVFYFGMENLIEGRKLLV